MASMLIAVVSLDARIALIIFSGAFEGAGTISSGEGQGANRCVSLMKFLGQRKDGKTTLVPPQANPKTL
jgi:hypothetical protein